MANRVKFGVDFDVNQSGLEKIKSSLQSIQNLKVKDLVDTKKSVDNLKQLKDAARSVQTALESAYNPKLDSINIEKFNSSIKASGQSIASIKSNFDMAGEAGKKAFRDVTGELFTTNQEIKETHHLLDSIAKTFGNTIKWQIASTAINKFTNSIQRAYSFAKKLDESLNNIQIVTNKSSDSMADFARQANRAAKSLGSATTEYTNASLIYYQQGLADEDVRVRTDVTTKVANVTKQSAQEVSEQLTSVWNGYKVSAAEAELYIDKLSAVAASSASDLQELSEGMSKVASAANAMGVDIDQLTAQISTIVSVTRQDAASVGTALKTIYARMGDLAVQGEDEFGVALGDVTSKLQVMGINVLDQMGNLRDMGAIIEEVAGKWGIWTEAQQQAAAVALAGKRQYNNLIALFENWDMYESSLNISQNSAGTLQKQQDTYMESLEAHLNQLSVAGERVYDAFFDSDSFKGILDFVTAIVDKFGEFIEAIGGGGNLLLTFGGIATQVFSKQIAGSLNTTITNLQKTIANSKENAAQDALLEEYKELKAEDLGKEQYQEILRIKENELKYSKLLTEEEQKKYKEILEQTIALQKQEEALEDNKKAAEDFYKSINKDNLEITGLSFTKDWENQHKIGNKRAVERLEREQISNDIDIRQINAYKQAAGAEKNILDKINTGRADESDFVAKDIDVYRDLLQALQDYKDGATELEDYIYELNEELLKTGSIQEKAFSTDDIDKLSEAIENATEKANILKKAEESRQKLLEKADKLIGDNLKGQVSQNAINRLDKAKTAYNNNKKALNDPNTDALTEGARRKAAEEQKKIEQELVDALAQIEEEKRNNIKKTIQTIEEAAEEEERITKEKQAKLDEEAELNRKKQQEKNIQDITNMAGAITQLTGTVMSLINLGSIWQNEDADTGQKILQTIMVLIPAIASLASVTKLWNGVKALGTVLRQGFAAATATETTAQTANTAATAANTAAQTANAAATGAAAVSTWALVWPVLILIAVIGALILLIWGISKAFENYNKSIHKAELTAEEANKAYETQTKALQEVKQAYDDLKNSIESYQDAQSAIDELVAGTDEWKESIIEANNQVLDLLNTYGELADYIDTDENGRLTIRQEGLDKIVEEQQKAVQEQQQKTLIAQARKNSTANEAAKEKILNNGIRDPWTVAGSIGAALFGPLGIPYWITKAVKQDKANKVEDNMDEIMSRIQSSPEMMLNKEVFSDALRDLKLDSSMIDALWANADNLKEAADQIKANTKANEVLNRQIAAGSLTGNQSYEDTEYKDIIQQRTAKEAQKNVDDIEAAMKAGYDKDDNRVREDYAKSLGEGYKVKDDKVVGPDGTEIDLSKDEMIRQMAEKKAYDGAAKKADDFVKEATQQIQNLDKTFGKEVGHLIYQFVDDISSDISQITETELKSLSTDIEGLTEDEKKAIEEIQKSYKQTINKLKAQSSAAVVEIFDNFNKSDMSVAAQKQLANTLNDIFKFGGKEGIEKANEFLSQYSAEELEKILPNLENLDWSASDINQQIANAFEAAGISIDITGDAYSNFIDNLRNSRSIIADVTTDFKSLRTTMDEIHEIAKDLKFGDVIDDDYYKKLIAQNVALKDSFVLTRDGYKFIGESAEVLEAAANHNVRTLGEYTQSLSIVQASVDKLKEEDLDFSVTDSGNVNIETLKTLNSDEYAEVLKHAGFSSEKVSDMAEILAVKDEKITESNKKHIAELLKQDADISDKELEELWTNARANALKDTQNLYSKIKDIMNSDLEITDDTIQYFMSQAKDFDELRQIRDEAGFGADDANYQKVYKVMMAAEVEALDLSVEAWNKWAETHSDAEQEASLAIQKYAKILSETDITSDITREIERLENELDNLQDKESRLIGKDLIANLQQQEKLQQELIDKQKEKQALIEEEIAAQKAAYEDTQNRYQKAGYDFDIYNTDGSINYAKLAEIKKNASESELEMLEEIVSAEEKYNSALEKELDIKNEIRDSANQLLEQQINRYDATIQLEIDTANAERDFYDFIEKISDSDEFAKFAQMDLSKALTYFDGAKGGTLNTNFEALKAAQAALDAAASGVAYEGIYKNKETGEIDQTAAKEARDKYLEAAKSDAESLMSLYDSVKNRYIDALNDVSDKFAEQTEIYENIQNRIAHDMNIIKLIYGDNAFSKLDDYYKTQQQMYQNTLALQQSEFDLYTQRLEELKAQGKDAQDEIYKEVLAKQIQALESLNSTLESSLQAAQDAYLNSLDSAFEEFKNKLTGGMGLDSLTEQWESANAQADRYLDTINRAYSIQSLENKYNKSLDDLKNSTTAQKKLNDLKNKELEMLKQKDKLSQYDIDRANLQYELALKRIQLEEAQNTASKMKLTRDENGNYRYQFVADENKTRELQEEISDLENQLYNMDVDEFKSQGDNMLSAIEDFMSKMREAMQIKDEDKRNNMIAILKDEYFGPNGVLNDIGYAMDNVSGNLEDITKALGFNGNMNEYIAGWGKLDEIFNNLKDGSLKDNLFNQLDDALSQYEDTVNEIKNIYDTINKDFSIQDQLDNSMISSTEELEKSCNAQLDSIQSVMDKMDELREKWSETIENIATFNGIAVGIDIKQLKDLGITGLDTGGYTGEWGSDGRLAVLHQKELVLNADDTENMLNIVGMVRDLVRSMAGAAMKRANGWLDAIDATSIVNAEFGEAGGLEQFVTIEANFPDATDRGEIQAAFNNLINLAIQRAGLNNRRA